MRKQAKPDANQQDILDALRELGVSAEAIHYVGGGLPDILVGHAGKSYVFEVKNPEYDCKLTADEQEFKDTWRGQYDIIVCVEDVLDVIGLR